MVELATQKNLTETRRAVYRTQVLKDIGEQNMIVFAPKNPKYTITVFTDIDCGYCRLLHSQIDKYNEKGIAVRYAFFPRAGIDSESSKTAQSVWCSKDRRDALTRAKKGEKINAAQCPNPVAREYRAGLDIGVRGTPAIVTAEGRMIGGYMPPDKLLAELSHPSN
jgi:thiol:disulfide interchange protein DsbC